MQQLSIAGELKSLHLEIQKELLKLFNETALLICEGQQLDLDFEHGGEKQRISIARAILNEPKLILARIRNICNKINKGMFLRIQNSFDSR